ncbi:MAG TPA: hypothetical protein VF198_14275 [Vicinamibacterales bacterium]
MSTTVVPELPDLQYSTLDEEGWPILRPTVVTIERNSPEDVRNRQVIISLDGERIATLLYGQSCSREIAPGRHRLRANNTLVWKTVEFDAEPGVEVRFRCVNWAPGSFYYLLGLFGVSPLFVRLERVDPPNNPS